MDKILIHHRLYDLLETIAENDDYIINIVQHHNQTFKAFCFKNLDAYNNYLKNYIKLKESAINLPKLIKKDNRNGFLVFKNLSGDNLKDILLKRELNDEEFYALFIIESFARYYKVALNYLPENFLYFKKRIYYLDNYVSDEHNPNQFIENDLLYYLPTKVRLNYLRKFNENYQCECLEGARLSKQIVLTAIKFRR